MLYSVNFQFSDRWEASITKMLLENYQIDLRFVRFDISLTYLWPDHELLNWNRFIEFRIINTPYIWKILNLILELKVLGWHPRIWILVRWKFIFEFWVTPFMRGEFYLTIVLFAKHRTPASSLFMRKYSKSWYRIVLTLLSWLRASYHTGTITVPVVNKTRKCKACCFFIFRNLDTRRRATPSGDLGFQSSRQRGRDFEKR